MMHQIQRIVAAKRGDKTISPPVEMIALFGEDIPAKLQLGV